MTGKQMAVVAPQGHHRQGCMGLEGRQARDAASTFVGR